MKRDYKIVKKDREGLDAVRRPTAIEVAWAAGIYEGEGSYITNHNGTGSKSFVISVNQDDPELLHRMREMFGGSIKLCNRTFNGVLRPIYHWKVCGDRARAFIFTIYPFLTARRKAQVEATPAGEFLEQVQDILRFDITLGKSEVYESIWTRINEYDAQQREKALEHKRKYQAEYNAKQSADPVYRERKRLEQQERRKLRKAQQKAQVISISQAA
jgi:hypothetical protein